MNYYRFFISNPKILIFTILFTFFSGFGQTFLLSIYIPHFLEDFALSRTFYSTIYSIATIISGISLIFAGKIIDRVSVKSFAVAVIIGFTIANFVASFALNAFTLFLAVFLLRFFGQGLSTHTAFTVAGKYFNKARGKALSIAYLGFPLTEGIMPTVILTLIAIFGWRETFQLSGISIILILLPLTLFLLHGFSSAKIKEESDVKLKKNPVVSKLIPNEKLMSQKDVIKNYRFYLIAPMPFLVGFLITALFFFQTFIAEFKDWTIEWMALNISVYAVSSFVFSMLGGPLIDRFTAVKLFPFIILPLVVGLFVLNIFSHPYFAALYWFFVGISAGLNSTVSNALYAEVYGTKSLGGVRSLFTFVMVIGTALGPVLYSLLLDAGLSFATINYLISSVIVIYFLIVLFKLNRVRLELLND